ncbi:MAG TPA: hypothetical protein VFS37_07590 [Conexibacter sp.]|nr:hypothetical protein [Conexibacter sp.]
MAAVAAMAALMVAAGAAQAVFPNFSGCRSSSPAEGFCVDIQQRSGSFEIKGFRVPLHESLEIRGKLIPNETEFPTFVPPAGTNGFFARPERVPGGLLGIEWLPGNSVEAITELAGPASSIRINPSDSSVSLPIKVRLVNLLLGMDCHIGNNRNPVRLNLIVGTTSPPPPNRPISGEFGTFAPIPGGLSRIGQVNVENSFAVPGATECGLGLGLINSLVNARLRLPSAAGNNSMSQTSDVAIALVP